MKQNSKPCAGTTKKLESLANFCTYSLWLGMQGAKKRRDCLNLFTSATHLREWLLPQTHAKYLWTQYVESGYDHLLTPSLSRIDPSGNYSPLNCQLLTRFEVSIKNNINPNCGKRKHDMTLPTGVSPLSRHEKPWYAVGGSVLSTQLNFPQLLTKDLAEALDYNARKRTAIIYFLDTEGVLFPDAWR